MTVSTFPLEGDAPVPAVSKAAQSRQGRFLSLPQVGEDIADYTVQPVRRLSRAHSRLARHSFRNFQLLHPDSTLAGRQGRIGCPKRTPCPELNENRMDDRQKRSLQLVGTENEENLIRERKQAIRRLAMARRPPYRGLSLF
jgi:hypothetical protein